MDLRFRIHQTNPQKVQLHEGYRGANNIARLIMILFRHRDIKSTLDGNQITEVTVFKKDNI